MTFFETIRQIFEHPFVILLIGIVIGKWYFLPRLLKDKSIEYKVNTVKRIVDVRNVIKEIEFLYDRTYSSLSKYGLVNISRDIITSEIDKISLILNERLPLSKKYLDTEIEVFYCSDKKVQYNYNEYCMSLKQFHDFLLSMPEWDNKIFKSKLSDLPQIKESKLFVFEEKLIKAVQNGLTIYDDFR